MLDCPLETPPFATVLSQSGKSSQQAQVFPSLFQAPQLTGLVDLATVDCILISNYETITALPYITQFTDFKGKIYATEPTKQFGRLVMEELVHFRSASVTDGGVTSTDSKMRNSLQRGLYTAHDVESCMQRVRSVSFQEDVVISDRVQIRAVSSGYAIGSANWIIQTTGEKIAYMAASSSSSSRHPEPLDLDSLRNVDVVIMSHVSPESVPRPDSMLTELFSLVGGTVRDGGSVLVPCYCTGVVLDLLEYLHSYLSQNNLRTIPMYFISPVADAALSYANIDSEWLCSVKQDHVLSAEDPFPHDDLIKAGYLYAFNQLGSDPSSSQKQLGQVWREPCVVFAGHPSLQLGPARHFVNLWKDRADCCVICIDPMYDRSTALAPFQSTALRGYWYPLDPRLGTAEASRVLREIKPRVALLPGSILPVGLGGSLAGGGVQPPVGDGCSVIALVHQRVASVPLPSSNRPQKAHIASAVARDFVPLSVPLSANTSGAVCHLNDVQLVQRAGQWLLVSDVDQPRRDTRHTGSVVCGVPVLHKLLSSLESEGIDDMEVQALAESSADSQYQFVIHIRSLQVRLMVGASHSLIESPLESSRTLLADIISSQMLVF